MSHVYRLNSWPVKDGWHRISVKAYDFFSNCARRAREIILRNLAEHVKAMMKIA